MRTLASQVPLMRDRGFDAAPVEPAVEGIAMNDYLARTPFEHRFPDAWNSHHTDRVIVLMTEDIAYHDDAWPKTMRGHAEVREFLDALWKAFPTTFE
jgi:nuclear transport factor 2 (NTF2) superfamily protein